MGKTKNQGASAARAASALLNNDGTIGFAGFQGMETCSVFELNPDTRQTLGKLTKKDPVTKQKALQELQQQVAAGDADSAEAVLTHWVRLYPKLYLDSNRQVREASLMVIGQLGAQAKKKFMPFLKQLVGPWLASRYDPAKNVSVAAKTSFEGVFTSQERRRKTIMYCIDSLMEFVHNSLLKQTEDSLSEGQPDFKDPHEKAARHARSLQTCLSLLVEIISTLAVDPNAETSVKSMELLEELATSSVVWKLGGEKQPSPQVRVALFELACVLIRYRKDLVQKCLKRAVVTIMQGLTDSQSSVIRPCWEATLRMALEIPEMWTVVSPRKAIWPNIWILLKSGCRGQAKNVSSTFAKFLACVPDTVIQKGLGFHNALWEAYLEGITCLLRASTEEKQASFEGSLSIFAHFQTRSICAQPNEPEIPDDATNPSVKAFITDKCLTYLSTAFEAFSLTPNLMWSKFARTCLQLHTNNEHAKDFEDMWDTMTKHCISKLESSRNQQSTEILKEYLASFITCFREVIVDVDPATIENESHIPGHSHAVACTIKLFGALCSQAASASSHGYCDSMIIGCVMKNIKSDDIFRSMTDVKSADVYLKSVLFPWLDKVEGQDPGFASILEACVSVILVLRKQENQEICQLCLMLLRKCSVSYLKLGRFIENTWGEASTVYSEIESDVTELIDSSLYQAGTGIGNLVEQITKGDVPDLADTLELLNAVFDEKTTMCNIKEGTFTKLAEAIADIVGMYTKRVIAAPTPLITATGKLLIFGIKKITNISENSLKSTRTLLKLLFRAAINGGNVAKDNIALTIWIEVMQQIDSSTSQIARTELREALQNLVGIAYTFRGQQAEALKHPQFGSELSGTATCASRIIASLESMNILSVTADPELVKHLRRSLTLDTSVLPSFLTQSLFPAFLKDFVCLEETSRSVSAGNWISHVTYVTRLFVATNMINSERALFSTAQKGELLRDHLLTMAHAETLARGAAEAGFWVVDELERLLQSLHEDEELKQLSEDPNVDIECFYLLLSDCWNPEGASSSLLALLEFMNRQMDNATLSQREDLVITFLADIVRVISKSEEGSDDISKTTLPQKPDLVFTSSVVLTLQVVLGAVSEHSSRLKSKLRIVLSNCVKFLQQTKVNSANSMEVLALATLIIRTLSSKVNTPIAEESASARTQAAEKALERAENKRIMNEKQKNFLEFSSFFDIIKAHLESDEVQLPETDHEDLQEMDLKAGNLLGNEAQQYSIGINLICSQVFEIAVTFYGMDLTSQQWDTILCTTLAWLEQSLSWSWQSSALLMGALLNFAQINNHFLELDKLLLKGIGPDESCASISASREWTDFFAPSVTSFLMKIMEAPLYPSPTTAAEKEAALQNSTSLAHALFVAPGSAIAEHGNVEVFVDSIQKDSRGMQMASCYALEKIIEQHESAKKKEMKVDEDISQSILDGFKASVEALQALKGNSPHELDATETSLFLYGILFCKLIHVADAPNRALFANTLQESIGALPLIFNCAVKRLALLKEKEVELAVARDLYELEKWTGLDHVGVLGCTFFFTALLTIPAITRTWFEDLGRGRSSEVSQFTSKYLSAHVVQEEISTVRAHQNGPVVEDENSFTVKVRSNTGEVVGTYTMEDIILELIVRLPAAHPLQPVEVECPTRVGVSSQQWRTWLLQMVTYLSNQNGSILDAFLLWKENVEKKFEGVEDCCICYSAIHASTYSLPDKHCRTCRNAFHAHCLYKWFHSSQQSTCPLCRNTWMI
eukprot:m.124628 g.124628  ORF g.124628 m.124628 type:complete len:1753 (-) comp14477_c0_seq4:842-6100(-)